MEATEERSYSDGVSLILDDVAEELLEEAEEPLGEELSGGAGWTGTAAARAGTSRSKLNSEKNASDSGARKQKIVQPRREL